MQDAHDSPKVEVSLFDGGASSRQVGLDFNDVTGTADTEIKPVRVAAGGGPLDLAPERKLAQDVARLVEVTARGRCNDVQPSASLSRPSCRKRISSPG